VVSASVQVRSLSDPSLRRAPLKKGDKGPAVDELQQDLVTLKYLPQASGEFDAATQRAVREFQYEWELKFNGERGAVGAQKHLESAGVFGPESAAAMKKALPGKPPPGFPAEVNGKPQDLRYPGGAPLAGFPNKPGTITFQDPLPAIPDAWEGPVCAAPHVHFATQLCADINMSTTHYKGELHQCADGPDKGTQVLVYGPDVEFWVHRRFLGSGFGGVVVAVIEDRDVRISFAHLSHISTEVYQAAKERRPLPPGTYLGATIHAVGVQAGTHLHIQATDLDFTSSRRRDWFPKLRQHPQFQPADDPPVSMGDPERLAKLVAGLIKAKGPTGETGYYLGYDDHIKDALRKWRDHHKPDISHCSIDGGDGSEVDSGVYGPLIS
jgi:hypothetical protein